MELPGEGPLVKHKPKNILITGAAGFIASHVARRLIKLYPKYKIIGFDKLDYCSAIDNLKDVRGRPNFKFVKGDIQDSNFVMHLILTENIDTIMHFAAQTHVDNSFGTSLDFTQSNIVGTHILLEVARTSGRITRFLHVSTDEVYGGRFVLRGNHVA